MNNMIGDIYLVDFDTKTGNGHINNKCGDKMWQIHIYIYILISWFNNHEVIGHQNTYFFGWQNLAFLTKNVALLISCDSTMALSNAWHGKAKV